MNKIIFKKIKKTQPQNNKNILIYIICINKSMYDIALKKYLIYKWIKPIIINYSDYTFENIFWKQFENMEYEWTQYLTIGIISYMNFNDSVINTINNIIINNKFISNNYYCIINNNNKIFHNNNYNIIWDKIINLFDYKKINNYNCYNFICTPNIMKKYIFWYYNICLNKLSNSLDILEDSKITYLKENELLKIWGKKYYPIFPFIIERLNKYFFDNLSENINYNINFCKNKYYPLTKCENITTIIYILCKDEDTLQKAYDNFLIYKWAKPIILKYQDYTFENTFWRFQLDELKSEWENYEMVGCLSYSSFKKINLENVNDIILNKKYLPNSFYHFFKSKIQIPNDNTNNHPFFNIIWNNTSSKLKLVNIHDAFCNYWMCKPKMLEHFINWYNNECHKVLIEEPNIFENAYYNNISLNYNNLIEKNMLIKLWNNNFYPHYPFIAERLNTSFFVTNYSIVFLITHEESNTGAPIALLNLQNFYNKNNIKTILLNIHDIDKDNIISLIIKTSYKLNCSPIVICNTLVCYKIIDVFLNTNIPTYWYIHEWIDNSNNLNNYYIKNLNIFNSSIIPIFVCNKSYENLKQFIPNININKLIIYNGISLELIEEKKKAYIENPIYKNNNIIISIIGTICKRKNQINFINDVFIKIINKYKNIKLMLVGKNCYKNINNLINPLCKNNIIFVGEVSNAIPYINLSDIVVSYSINEVFPLNILESFYCKIPVISTNVGGITELITHEQNGYLFKPNDKDTCFILLSKLIKNENLRKKIGDFAHETFLNKFVDDITYQQFLLLLH